MSCSGLNRTLTTAILILTVQMFFEWTLYHQINMAENKVTSVAKDIYTGCHNVEQGVYSSISSDKCRIRHLSILVQFAFN
jgi:hypothetical protein